MKGLPVAVILLSFFTSYGGAAAQGTIPSVSAGNTAGASLPAQVDQTAQNIPLRPPIFAPPSAYSFTPSQTSTAPIPIGALPPSSNGLPPPAPPAVATNIVNMNPPAGNNSTQDPHHHKGLVDDTIDVGAYVVKAYVWTYIVLPSEIVKETAKILF